MREFEQLKAAVAGLEKHVATTEETMQAHVGAYVSPTDINSILASVNTLTHRLDAANSVGAVALAPVIAS